MELAEFPMVELDEITEGVRDPLDHPVSRWDSLNRFVFRKIAHKLAELPMVELDEITEGVQEHHDHLVSC